MSMRNSDWNRILGTEMIDTDGLVGSKFSSNLETDQSGFNIRQSPHTKLMFGLSQIRIRTPNTHTHALRIVLREQWDVGAYMYFIITPINICAQCVAHSGRPVMMPVRLNNGWIPQSFWLKNLVSNTNGQTQHARMLTHKNRAHNYYSHKDAPFPIPIRNVRSGRSVVQHVHTHSIAYRVIVSVYWLNKYTHAPQRECICATRDGNVHIRLTLFACIPASMQFVIQNRSAVILILSFIIAERVACGVHAKNPPTNASGTQFIFRSPYGMAMFIGKYACRWATRRRLLQTRQKYDNMQTELIRTECVSFFSRRHVPNEFMTHRPDLLSAIVVGGLWKLPLESPCRDVVRSAENVRHDPDLCPQTWLLGSIRNYIRMCRICISERCDNVLH